MSGVKRLQITCPDRPQPDEEVIVTGTVADDGYEVTCTLTGYQYTQTRVAVPEDNKWQVNFGRLAPGSYSVSATADDERPVRCVIDVGARLDEDRFEPLVLLSGNTTSPVQFWGSVRVAGNTVTCTLTGSGVNITKSVTATAKSWSVDFGQQPAGTYNFSACAPSEGCTGETITVT